MFSFVFSVIAFLMSVFYPVIDTPQFDSLNGIIYFSIQLILIAICLTGVIINMPHYKFISKLKRNGKYNKIQA